MTKQLENLKVPCDCDQLQITSHKHLTSNVCTGSSKRSHVKRPLQQLKL